MIWLILYCFIQNRGATSGILVEFLIFKVQSHNDVHKPLDNDFKQSTWGKELRSELPKLLRMHRT